MFPHQFPFVAQQPLTTTPRDPYIPTYHSPHPNPNLWVPLSISQSHSHEPSIPSVYSQFVPTNTMTTQPISQSASPPPTCWQPHTIADPKPLCPIPENDRISLEPDRLHNWEVPIVDLGYSSFTPEPTVKLQGAEKPSSPPRGSGKLSHKDFELQGHKDHTDAKLCEMQKSFKSSTDAFMSEFREELRWLRASKQTPAGQVDNPLKFGSLPPSTHEIIPATIKASSSVVSSSNGNPIITSLNTGLNLSHHEVGTEPLASAISTISTATLVCSDKSEEVVSGANTSCVTSSETMVKLSRCTAPPLCNLALDIATVLPLVVTEEDHLLLDMVSLVGQGEADDKPSLSLFEQNLVIQISLVDFYARTGCVDTARQVINRIPQPDLVPWNALIAGYSSNGFNWEALEVVREIVFSDLRLNLSTLASIVPVCTRLGCVRAGKSLHCFAVKSGYFSNDFLVPALSSMYARDGDICGARKLFDSVVEKNVAIWNAMISAYTQRQEPVLAFELFRSMLLVDIRPNLVTFMSIIPSFENFISLSFGESLHACVVKHGSENQLPVLTALVSLYAKLGSIDESRYLFNQMQSKNLLLWNSMISGYVYNGLWDLSLGLFREMQVSRFDADAVSVINILSACSKLEADMLGRSAHAFSIRTGIHSNINLSNALLAFYSDCHCLSYSIALFHKMPLRNGITWNTLISSCVHHGEKNGAVALYYQMQKEGFKLDLVTLTSILPSWSDEENLGQGMAFHGYAIKRGFASDISLLNSLISMYFNCGDLDAGRLVFETMAKRTVVSWNAMMTGLKNHNLQNEVMAVFGQMIKDDQRPNYVTLLNLLPACYFKLQGKSIHALAVRTSILHETPLLSSLMFMYARFDYHDSCILLFKTRKMEDISLWNAIMSVQIQAKSSENAVGFFNSFLQMKLKPDNLTLLNLVSSCAQLNSLTLANSVMGYIIRKGFDKYLVISNALNSSALQMWLVGYPDTLRVFMKKQIQFLGSQKKVQGVKKSATEAPGVDVVRHKKTKSVDGTALMDAILGVIYAQSKAYGHDTVMVGRMAREDPKGNLLQWWFEKLKSAIVQLGDVTNGLLALLAVKEVYHGTAVMFDVAHVINFDFSKSIDDYVHKIGPTGMVVELIKESKQEVPNWLIHYAQQSLYYGGDQSQSYICLLKHRMEFPCMPQNEIAIFSIWIIKALPGFKEGAILLLLELITIWMTYTVGDRFLGIVANIDTSCSCNRIFEAALEHLVLASRNMVANGQEVEVNSVDSKIGDTYLPLSGYDEAVFAYEKALNVFKTTKGENHPSVGSVFIRLADLYNRTGKITESISYCENALRGHSVNYLKVVPSVVIGFTVLVTWHLIKGVKEDSKAEDKLQHVRSWF